MINNYEVQRFCKDYKLIENYEKAINDKTQTWVCHHRLGIYFTKNELINANMYKNISPYELIFMTEYDHKVLHGKNNKHTIEALHKANIGHHRKQSEEAKNKNRIAHLGKPCHWKGEHLSEEHKRKVSEAIKGKRKINNGSINIYVKPEDYNKYITDGWKPGFISKNKK